MLFLKSSPELGFRRFVMTAYTKTDRIFFLLLEFWWSGWCRRRDQSRRALKTRIPVQEEALPTWAGRHPQRGRVGSVQEFIWRGQWRLHSGPQRRPKRLREAPKTIFEVESIWHGFLVRVLNSGLYPTDFLCRLTTINCLIFLHWIFISGDTEN